MLAIKMGLMHSTYRVAVDTPTTKSYVDEKIEEAEAFIDEELKAIHAKLDNLESENKQLKDENARLKSSQVISQNSIDKFVHQLLSDPNVNVSIIPDSVESKVYKTIITSILHSLSTTLANSSVAVFGHNITFNLEPQ